MGRWVGRISDAAWSHDPFPGPNGVVSFYFVYFHSTGDFLCLFGPNNPHFWEGSIKLMASVFLFHRVTEARLEQLVDLAVRVHLWVVIFYYLEWCVCVCAGNITEAIRDHIKISQGESISYNGGQNSLGHLSNCINFLCFQNGVLKENTVIRFKLRCFIPPPPHPHTMLKLRRNNVYTCPTL